MKLAPTSPVPTPPVRPAGAASIETASCPRKKRTPAAAACMCLTRRESGNPKKKEKKDRNPISIGTAWSIAHSARWVQWVKRAGMLGTPPSMLAWYTPSMLASYQKSNRVTVRVESKAVFGRSKTTQGFISRLVQKMAPCRRLSLPILGPRLPRT